MPFSLGSDAISLLISLLGLDEVVRTFRKKPFFHKDTAVEQLLIDLNDLRKLIVDLPDFFDLGVEGMNLLRVEIQYRLDLLDLPHTLCDIVVDAVNARLVSSLHIREAL